MSWWHAKDTNPDEKKNRGEIWIWSDNWSYARQSSWEKLGLEAIIRQSGPPPTTAYRRKLVYKSYWVGNAAGTPNTLERKFELMKKSDGKKSNFG